MNIKTTIAAVALTLVAGTASAAVNIVTNPGFEDPNFGLPASGYLYTNSVTGWTVTGNPTVLFNSTYRPVSEGLQAVQIERNNDSLSQSLSTVVGQQYLLSFDWSSYTPAPPNSQLTVNVGGASTVLNGGSGNAYTTASWLFTATAASTLLSFTNTGPTFTSYPQIDNVSVTAVPEPGTVAMLLAGLATVGFLTKRRGG